MNFNTSLVQVTLPCTHSAALHSLYATDNEAFALDLNYIKTVVIFRALYHFFCLCVMWKGC